MMDQTSLIILGSINLELANFSKLPIYYTKWTTSHRSNLVILASKKNIIEKAQVIALGDQ